MPLILSSCNYGRPLSRAWAKAINRPKVWSCGDTRADRVVIKQHLSTSAAYYWWPRRKGEDGSIETDPMDLYRNSEGFESHPDTAPWKYRRKVQRRIHILGAGALGKFVAHALAGIPNPPPMTLLFRRPGSLVSWQERGCSIQVTTGGMMETRRGYEVELVPRLGAPQKNKLNEGSYHESETEPAPENTQEEAEVVPFRGNEQDADANEHTIQEPNSEPIYSLIVSVKAPETAKAVLSVAHRLTRDSIILFLQNGMGMVEEVNEKVFPDEETRPNYVVGVISHGVYPRGPFSVVHAGIGTTAISLLPRKPGQPQAQRYTPSAGHLLRTLTRTPVLAAVSFAPTDLLQMQFEKLAINAIINPLTVMFDCRNGEILYNASISRVMRLLLAEISLVIRSLPELQNVPNVKMRFAPDRLEAQVVSVAAKTADNLSSMQQDVEAGRLTEIDYISGYIIRRGEELGIKCVTNYMLLHMVKGKSFKVKKKDDELLPMRRWKGLSRASVTCIINWWHLWPWKALCISEGVMIPRILSFSSIRTNGLFVK